jgi:DNA-binding response OmpR family regulator
VAGRLHLDASGRTLTAAKVKKRLHKVRKDVQGKAVDMVAHPRLLLIDDEPALADFVASAARLCGFEPAVAADEDSFRRLFDAHDPSVVVLDLGMPRTDGVEYLRFLSDHGFKGPVLIVSGFDRRVLESAFRLGSALGLSMAGPLEKPVRLEELETLLLSLKDGLVP